MQTPPGQYQDPASQSQLEKQQWKCKGSLLYTDRQAAAREQEKSISACLRDKNIMLMSGTVSYWQPIFVSLQQITAEEAASFKVTNITVRYFKWRAEVT